jgi:hypothetical protein
MAEGIIKRTDSTVRIEHFIEEFIGGFFKAFVPKIGGAVASGIADNKLKFQCKHCGYFDDIKRQFCLSCSKNSDGFYIEDVLPYKCNYCFNKFTKPFKYCPKCSKNEKGKHENGSF